MRELANLFAIAADDYQGGMAVTNHIGHIGSHCLSLLQSAELHPLATCDAKSYHVFRDGKALSRPVCASLFVKDPEELEASWQALTTSTLASANRYHASIGDINSTIYSLVVAFAVCYDLWRTGSRKTPGTFFELLIGSLIQTVVPAMGRRAHIALREPGESVSTDIAFLDPRGDGGLVVPAKITTRERIVQPFAHQRILDSVYGAGRFRSVLVCVSEMQRRGEAGANAICVPGTIRLFQRHLAPLDGIYYLDPPARYLQADVVDHVPVRTIGDLLAHDLPSLVRSKQV